MSSIYSFVEIMRKYSRKNLLVNRQAQSIASIQSKLLFQTKLRALHILSSPQWYEVAAISILN